MKLISFLGTSKYDTVVYAWDDKQKKTPFVQAALIDFLPDVSEMVVVATDEAWRQNGDGLIESLPERCRFRRLKCEENDWIGVFYPLNEVIAPGDTLVIDITHSFRSIPMATLPLIKYLRLTKDVHIAGIYYGRIVDKNQDPWKAQIDDLSQILEVEQWIQAVGAFLEYGKADQLSAILGDAVGSLFRASKDRPESRPYALGILANALQALGEALDTNRLARISKKAEELKELLADAEWRTQATGLSQLLIPLAGQLVEDVSIFEATGSSSRSQLRLARWNLDHHDLVSAALVAREAAVTQLMHANGQSCRIRDERAREELVGRLSKTHPVFTVFRQLADVRNSLAHCGMRGQREDGKELDDRDIKPGKVPEQLRQIIHKLEVMLDDDQIWRVDEEPWMLNDNRGKEGRRDDAQHT
ncbi:MAG: TIGR02221 family CRISPR-associated protein [Firmicutes bacterium]|nr:TIGR02221 family CRISPR-associated protein [Bacillota bacterium]